MGISRTVHCEKSGKETTLDKTRIVTKINAVINLKLFNDVRVDEVNRIIYSSNKPPVNFFSKLHVPDNLKPILGELYSRVADEDELEQSTHILSDEGRDYLMGTQLIQLVSYLDKYEVISFPETMFFVTVEDIYSFSSQEKKCVNWGVHYFGLKRKYLSKRILELEKNKQMFGYMNVLLPPFDLAVSDCSEKNPNGNGYLFRTDKNFISLDLCSNESAVDYCIKENCVIYYSDFLNGGQMRVLTEFTESINKNLGNAYKFRSSNL
jgi:hypothetical protein